jgi:hypothetical protein
MSRKPSVSLRFRSVRDIRSFETDEAAVARRLGSLFARQPRARTAVGAKGTADSAAEQAIHALLGYVELSQLQRATTRECRVTASLRQLTAIGVYPSAP